MNKAIRGLSFLLLIFQYLECAQLTLYCLSLADDDLEKRLDVPLHVLHLTPLPLAFAFRLLKLPPSLKLRQLLDQLRVRPLHLQHHHRDRGR